MGCDRLCVWLLSRGGITGIDFRSAAWPQPSSGYFNLAIKSSEHKEKIHLRAYDLEGRLLESGAGVMYGTIIQLGHAYRPGAY